MNKDIMISGEYYSIVNKLKNEKAQEYLRFGFNMRALYLSDIYREIFVLIENSGGTNINHYEISKFNILLNSFYINLHGAIDNLAWVIHYEFNIIDGANEKNKLRNSIGLFNKKYQESLSKIDGDLVKKINAHEAWYHEIKNFRDPAAHRIPLYCPPGIVTENDINTYNEALEKLLAQDYVKDRGAYMSAQYNLSKVGHFEPIFTSFSEDRSIYKLERTIHNDYDPFLDISLITLSFLKDQLSI